MRKHFNLIRRILNQSNLNFIFEKTLIYFGFNSCEAVLDGLAPFGDTAALVTGLECVVFIYANWDVVEYKLDDIKNLFYDFGADVQDIAKGIANGIIDAIKSLFTKVEDQTGESIEDDGMGNTVFPDTPEEMDELLGQDGKRVPDGPATPGRGKVKWKLSDVTTVTYEQHPYYEGAPDYHKKPHYHVDIHGETPHQRFMPGDDIPFLK